MTWNHRIIRYLDGLMVVAEVYYDDDGRPTAYCRASVDGDTIEELRAVLEQHREALNKPVLEEAMFNHEGCGGCDVCYMATEYAAENQAALPDSVCTTCR